MELTGFLLTLSSLRVSPDRSQFFKYESLSLSCESSNWTVKARTVRGVSACGHNWGLLQESACVISEAYTWNSGEYWCESGSGGASPAANITVTDSSVILESPLLPVMEGEAATLRCRTQSNATNLRASIFLKDRSAVGAAVNGQMILPAVSKADEGLYMCVVTGVGASTESWLAVRAKGLYETETAPVASTGGATATQQPDGFTGNVTQGSGSHFLSAARVVLLAAPYLLSTVLLGLVHRDRARGKSSAAVREEAQRAGPEEQQPEEQQPEEEEAADVATEHDF